VPWSITLAIAAGSTTSALIGLTLRTLLRAAADYRAAYLAEWQRNTVLTSRLEPLAAQVADTAAKVAAIAARMDRS
jgi:ubiquinone biosynthesis protein UbiJ